MSAVKVGHVEYRIRCADGAGHPFHASHVHPMKDYAAAVEAAARHNDLRNRPGCAPWIIEGRAISEWGDPDAAEMCLYAVGRTLRGQLPMAVEDKTIGPGQSILTPAEPSHD